MFYATLFVAVGFIILVYTHPKVITQYIQRKTGVIFSTNKDELTVTIDDSPSPQTRVILDVLDKHQKKAIFFVIGENAQKYPEQMKEIIRRGHMVANHDITNRASLFAKDLMSDIVKTEQIIRKYAPEGQYQKWFRPGCGYFSNNMVKMLDIMGYKTVLGDTYTMDGHLTTEWLMKMILKYKTGPGSIIIMHDGVKRAGRTARVLDDFLSDK